MRQQNVVLHLHAGNLETPKTLQLTSPKDHLKFKLFLYFCLYSILRLRGGFFLSENENFSKKQPCCIPRPFWDNGVAPARPEHQFFNFYVVIIMYFWQRWYAEQSYFCTFLVSIGYFFNKNCNCANFTFFNILAVNFSFKLKITHTVPKII